MATIWAPPVVAVGIGVGVAVGWELGDAVGVLVGAWLGVAVGAALALETGTGVGVAPTGVRVGTGVGELPAGVGVVAIAVGDAPTGIGELPTGVLPIGPGVIAPDAVGVADGEAVPRPGAFTGAISPADVGSEEPPPPLQAASVATHTTDDAKRLSERIETPPGKTRILNRFFGRRTWREHVAASSVSAPE